MEPENNLSAGISLQEYIAILRRRRMIILNSFVIIAVVGVIVTLITRPVYHAAAKILVEGQGLNLNTVDTTNPLASLFAINQQQSVATQVEVLQSRPLLDQVAKQAGAAVITVAQVKSTNVIQVDAEATDPKVAAAAPTALLQLFLSQDDTNNLDEITKAKNFAQEQAGIARKKLDRAEAELAKFKKQNQVAELFKNRDDQIERVGTLAAEYQRINTVLAGMRAQVAVNKALLAREPKMFMTALQATNTNKESLRTQIRTLQVQREGLTQPGGFTPKASQVRSLDGQIATLQTQLAAQPDLSVTQTSTPNAAYEALRARVLDGEAQAQTAATQARETGKELAAARSQVGRYAGWEVTLNRLVQTRESAANDEKLFTTNLNQLSLREKAHHATARVIEAAQVPTIPVRPKKAQSILFACLIGLFVGICLALLQEFLDDRINTSEDADRVLGLPSLGRVPALSAEDARLLPQMQGLNAASESYRVLRTNIHFASIDAPLRTLLVTSSSPGEGKTTTSLNLAFAMALDGKRVILVDADLRRPSLHKKLELPSVPGVTDVLLDDVSLEDALLEHNDMPGLCVMTAGSIPPNPGELLGSRKFRTLVEDLKQQADIVIFDSPPVLAAADSPILASQMDGVVLVVETGETRKSAAKQTLTLLRQARANLLGVAYNKMKASDEGGYYYYYNYSSPALTEDQPSRSGKTLTTASAAKDEEK